MTLYSHQEEQEYTKVHSLNVKQISRYPHVANKDRKRVDWCNFDE